MDGFINFPMPIFRWLSPLHHTFRTPTTHRSRVGRVTCTHVYYNYYFIVIRPTSSLTPNSLRTVSIPTLQLCLKHSFWHPQTSTPFHPHPLNTTDFIPYWGTEFSSLSTSTLNNFLQHGGFNGTGTAPWTTGLTTEELAFDSQHDVVSLPFSIENASEA